MLSDRFDDDRDIAPTAAAVACLVDMAGQCPHNFARRRAGKLNSVSPKAPVAVRCNVSRVSGARRVSRLNSGRLANAGDGINARACHVCLWQTQEGPEDGGEAVGLSLMKGATGHAVVIYQPPQILVQGVKAKRIGEYRIGGASVMGGHGQYAHGQYMRPLSAAANPE